MFGFDAGAGFDLVAATETAGNDIVASLAVANGGEKSVFADFHGEIVVLFLVSERAGHTAATCLDFLAFQSFGLIV